ncbi:MAG: phage integrase SAM-like domain-containing protein, partial [Planctomycetota bacterium]|nr:phage integrase SAM-like domain-containing protein [Planctomycetota bacterium]
MAFLNKHGQKGWQIVWNDRTKGRGKKGRRTVNCSRGNHEEAIKIGRLSAGQRSALANGATNRDQRASLLRCYTFLELSKAQEAVTAGGYGRGARHSTGLVSLIEKYLKMREALGELRESAGERKGKSPKTVEIDRAAIKKLKKWLKESGNLEIEAGELSKSLFEEFRLWLMKLPHERAKNRVISTVSVNKHLRSIRGCINYLADDQGNRPYFRVETKALLKGLRTEKEEQKVPACYKPKELSAFLKELILHDAGGKVTVKDKKNNREYLMTPRTTTELVPWFLLFALTGCRLSDAETLKWSAIDFDSGSITWAANKTYRERRLMLNDSKNTVCPILLDLLREWRKKRPNDVYVLKGNSRKKTPVFPKLPWEGVRAVLDLDITPKKLRSNWVS